MKTISELKLGSLELESAIEDFLHYGLDRKYFKKLQEITTTGEMSLTIDLSDLIRYNPSIVSLLYRYPLKLIPLFRKIAVALIDKFIDSDYLDEYTSKLFTIRISDNNNLQKTTLPRYVLAAHKYQLVKVSGTITSISQNYFKTAVAVARCPSGHTGPGFKFHFEDWEKPDLPKKCPICGQSLIYDEYLQKDQNMQLIMIQDDPEKLEPGIEPKELECILTGDAVNTDLPPGIRVEIVGVVISLQISPKSYYKLEKPMLYVLSMRQLDESEELEEITPEDIAEIKRYAKRADIIELLRHSIAPELYETNDMRLAKMAALISLFSAPLTTDTTRRMNTHVLLLGDPATGKTRLQMALRRLSPQSRFISSKNTTIAGLIGGVESDPLTKEWKIVAGAAALANGHLLLIAEADKLSPELVKALLEVMDEQEVAITKIGTHRTLKTQCSVIASANPIHSRFDNYQKTANQLPPTFTPAFISRFDYIVILRDIPDEETDRYLARTVIRNMFQVNKKEEYIPTQLLRKYILYARQTIRPKLTREVEKYLEERFTSMRSKSKINQEIPIISIDTRTLESWIRTTIAIARMMLSDKVTKQHVDLAIAIWDEIWGKLIRDEETGELDVDKFLMGPYSQRETLSRMLQCLRETIPEHNGHSDPMLSLNDWFEEYKSWDPNIDRDTFKEYVQTLYKRGDIYEPKMGFYAPATNA